MSPSIEPDNRPRPRNAKGGPRKRAAFWLVIAALAAGVAAARYIDRRFGVVAVGGASMSPALEPDDYVVHDRRAYRKAPPSVGHVVTAVDPRDMERTLLKRVAAVGPVGVELRGDNAEWSTDSREFGPVAPEAIRGRVVAIYWPPSRAGLVR